MIMQELEIVNYLIVEIRDQIIIMYLWSEFFLVKMKFKNTKIDGFQYLIS